MSRKVLTGRYLRQVRSCHEQTSRKVTQTGAEEQDKQTRPLHTLLVVFASAIPSKHTRSQHRHLPSFVLLSPCPRSRCGGCYMVSSLLGVVFGSAET